MSKLNDYISEDEEGIDRFGDILFNKKYEESHMDRKGQNKQSQDHPVEYNQEISDDPIYEMTLEIEGVSKIIKIYQDSIPEEISYNFCKENGLDSEAMNYLSTEIKNLLEKFKEKNNDKIIEVEEESNFTEKHVSVQEETANDVIIEPIKEDCKKNNIQEEKLEEEKNHILINKKEYNISNNYSHTCGRYNYLDKYDQLTRQFEKPIEQENFKSRTNDKFYPTIVDKSESCIMTIDPAHRDNKYHKLFINDVTSSNEKPTKVEYYTEDRPRNSGVFERLYNEAKVRISKAVRETSPQMSMTKTTSKSNTINFGDVLYEKGVKMIEKRKLQTAQILTDKIIKDNLTFSPQTNDYVCLYYLEL
jgi:hypothetical protein